MDPWEEGPSVSLVTTNSKAPQRQGVRLHPWHFLFLCALPFCLSRPLLLRSRLLSPRLPTANPLLVTHPPFDDGGPGQLPEPHQVPPLRFQPLLLRPGQPDFLLRDLDTRGQDQLRVLCGLVLHAAADLVQGAGRLGGPHHGPGPPGLRGGPQGAPLPPGPVLRDAAAPVRHPDHPGDPHLHSEDPAGAEGEGFRAGDDPELPLGPGEVRGRGELGLLAVPAALLRLALSPGLVPGPQPEQQRVGVPRALLLQQLVGDQRLGHPRRGLPLPVQPGRAPGAAQAQRGPVRLRPQNQTHLRRGLRAEPAEVAAQQPHLHRGHLPGRRPARAQLHDAVHIPVQKPGPRLRQARPVPIGPALPEAPPSRSPAPLPPCGL